MTTVRQLFDQTSGTYSDDVTIVDLRSPAEFHGELGLSGDGAS